jgi:prepilin-type N-terminal cleavage/methylation domain-containing protein
MFTLVEVMVALTIVSVVLLSLLQVRGHSIRLAQQAQEQQLCQLFALELITQASAESSSRAPSLVRGQCEQDLSLSWEREVTPLSGTGLPPGGIRIAVRIWRQDPSALSAPDAPPLAALERVSFP